MKRFLNECRKAHFLEHVERVVARCSVGTEGHRDAAREEIGDPGDPGAELEVRSGTVEHLCAPLPEESDFILADPDAMRQTGVGPEDAEIFKEFDVAGPAALAHGFHLPAVLRGVRVKEHAGK